MNLIYRIWMIVKIILCLKAELEYPNKLSLNYFSNVYSFDNINLVLLKKKDDYKIFSTFTHNDDNQLVHIL